MGCLDYRALSITRKSALMPMSARGDEHGLQLMRIQTAQTNEGPDRVAKLEITRHQQPG